MTVVAVPWFEHHLYFAPTQREVAALCLDGVPRGRIWSYAELRELVAKVDSQTDAVKIAQTKLLLDGKTRV